MSKQYTLDEQSRQHLADLLKKIQSEPIRSPLAKEEIKTPQAPDSYWALPPCETGLPAARLDSDGTLRATGIACCLYSRTGSSDLMPLLDPVGNPIRVVVYNYYQFATNDWVQVTRHKDGHWANERPLSIARGNNGGTTVAPPWSVADGISLCEGDCIWTADEHGNWGWPTGSCADKDTTTSAPTTSTTTFDPGGGSTSTTAPPVPIPTTPPPCSNENCLLKCSQVLSPTPLQPGLFYTLESGVCPDGCECYGLDDPCFMLDGIIQSRCLKYNYPPTTPPPPIPGIPCQVAQYIIPASPGTYRAVTEEGQDAWMDCQYCPDQTMPYFQIGGLPYREHSLGQVVIHDSPCLVTPCMPDWEGEDFTGQAVFRAFDLDHQLSYWGEEQAGPGGVIQQTSDGWYYSANWSMCSPCGLGRRPKNPPPVWIGPGVNEVPAGDRLLETVSGYMYVTECVQGKACGECPRGPVYVGTVSSGAILPGETTTTPDPSAPTTSTTSTTTPAPCGCAKPTFCATSPSQCVRTGCMRGGVTIAGGGTTPSPAPGDVKCLPNNSTTTATPSGTPPPDGCIDHYGQPCNCETTTPGPTTTSIPVNGVCPPGTYKQCHDGYCGCVCLPMGTMAPSEPDPPFFCQGSCRYICVDVEDSGSGPPTGRWMLVANDCVTPYGRPNSPMIRPGEEVGCGCVVPTQSCTVCGKVHVDTCVSTLSSTTPDPSVPPTTPTPPPSCACCTSTTPEPTCSNFCTYKGDGDGGWSLIKGDCPSNCNCATEQQMNDAYTSEDDCSAMQMRCGQTPPPPSTTPTSTTSSTPPPKPCCLSDGSCVLAEWPDTCDDFLSPHPEFPPFESAGCNGDTCTGACCYDDNGQMACVRVGRGTCDIDYHGTFAGFGTLCKTDTCQTTTTTTSTTTSTTSTTSTTTTTPPPRRCCAYHPENPIGCQALIGWGYCPPSYYEAGPFIPEEGCWCSGVCCEIDTATGTMLHCQIGVSSQALCEGQPISPGRHYEFHPGANTCSVCGTPTTSTTTTSTTSTTTTSTTSTTSTSTTSTTTTSTTSTTQPPLYGTCQYYWDETLPAWILSVPFCLGGRGCVYPSVAGTYDGEIVSTPCE